MTNWSSSWVVLEWAILALLVVLVLPFLLPPARRQGGGAARVSLALAVGLAFAAVATSELDAPGQVLQLGAVLALICGLIGLVGLLLFDFILPTLRIRVPSILRDVLQVGVAAVAVMVCLRLAGLDVLPLLTTSAVLTAVIGLALQAPIANLFGGLALQLDRTLGQGDWIDTGRYSGRIVEIGWRSTRIVTAAGDTLFLPNSQLLSGEVLNLSRPTEAHRTAIRISVHDRHPPGAVRQLLVNAIRDAPGVLDYPPPDALIADFGSAAITYEARYWLSEFEREAAIASDVRSRIWYALRRAGIPLARKADDEPASEVHGVTSDIDEREELLHRMEIFASLDEATLAQLAQRLHRFEFTAGEPIFYQGTVGDTLYIVDRGEVGVRIQVDGSTAEVARIGGGEIFGEMALLTGEPRAATCLARTEVTCYALDREGFESLLAENPAVAEQLSEILSQRQGELASQREGLSHASRERVQVESKPGLLSRMGSLFRRT